MTATALISNDDVRRLVAGRRPAGLRPAWLPFDPADNPTDGASRLLPGLSEHVTLGPELRKQGWRTRNRCDIRTGHATFDRCADVVKPGNRIGNVMVGVYVRAFTDTLIANGQHRDPGALQQFDLDMYVGMPAEIRAFIVAHGTTEKLFAAELFHSVGGRHTDHGWIVTRAQTNEFLRAWRTGPTAKSQLVLDGCAPYLAVAPRA